MEEYMEHLFEDSKLEYMEHSFEDSKLEKLAKSVWVSLFLCGKSFKTLNSKQGISEIYKIQRALGMLPQRMEKPKKSDQIAKEMRDMGNQAYKANNLMEALRLYTKSIRFAEFDGKEIALGYANRSAVTFMLEEYQNCIDDVNRALSCDKYPKHLHQKLFERRGKCFLALSQFKRALGDFKQAMQRLLETEIDTDKMKSLIDLLAECVGKQDIPTMPPSPTPQLTHRPSRYIQSASEAVDIKYSPEMGRHVVASMDINPGDILAIEKPFASVINFDVQDLFCDHCKRRCHSSIPCGSCVDVVFCSDQCREASWVAYHSVECDILHILIDYGCTLDLLAFRTLLVATDSGKNLKMFMDDFLEESGGPDKPEEVGFVGGKYLSDHYYAIHNLVTHSEKRPQEDLLLVGIKASSLVHILKQTTFFEHSDAYVASAALFKSSLDLQWNHVVAVDLLKRYILVSACNAYNTQEKQCTFSQDGQKLISGGAIFSFNSLFNHSCDPDTAFIPIVGNKQITIALKPITKGQQIFGNYRFIYQEFDLQTRRTFLARHFFFTCTCTACTEQWPVSTFHLDDIVNFVNKVRKTRHAREIVQSLDYVKRIVAEQKKGNFTEGQLQFCVKFLTFAYKNVKPPWDGFIFIQEAILSYFDHLFNHPTLKGTSRCKSVK